MMIPEKKSPTREILRTRKQILKNGRMKQTEEPTQVKEVFQYDLGKSKVNDHRGIHLHAKQEVTLKELHHIFALAKQFFGGNNL